jgi:hypothetical protein
MLVIVLRVFSKKNDDSEYRDTSLKSNHKQSNLLHRCLLRLQFDKSLIKNPVRPYSSSFLVIVLTITRSSTSSFLAQTRHLNRQRRESHYLTLRQRRPIYPRFHVRNRIRIQRYCSTQPSLPRPNHQLFY